MKRYPIPVLLLTIILFLGVQSGYAQSTPGSRDVFILLDSSGSMKMHDPDSLADKMTLSILGELSEKSRVGFIVFADEHEVAMPLTPTTQKDMDEEVSKILGKVKKSKSQKSGLLATVRLKRGETLWDLAEKYYGNPYKWPAIRAANRLPNSGRGIPVGSVIKIPSIDGKVASGDDGKERTNIPAAIENAIYELKKNGRSDALKQIILITDGIIEIKESALAVERYRWLKDELANDSKSSGIQVFGMALSPQADYELLQTLAQKTSGNYYRVFKNEDVDQAVAGLVKAESKPVPVVTPPKTQKTPKIAKQKPIVQDRELPWGLIIGGIGVVVVLGGATFAYVKIGRKGGVRRDRSIPGAYLMDLSGVTEKSNYAINKNIIKIGRAGNEDVDIWIDKGTVSSAHAQIEYRDSAFFLTDLGSTNGTYINDEPDKIVGEIRLKAGDIISFDQYKFKLVVRGPGERSGATQMGKNVPTKPHSRPSWNKASSPKQSRTPNISSSPSAPTLLTTRDADNAASDSEVAKLDAYLEDTSGITDKKTHKVSKRVVKIGRSSRPDIDICIDEPTVSSAHAQIEYKDDGFYLMDLGSRNGTYINEEKDRITSEVPLKGNDVIYFDQYKFKFVVHGQSLSGQAQLASSTGKVDGK